ncbi:hypothetical protein LZ198_03550 [Myxococcus sp. K15C18031901]|uniref:hypothetical protein n=1 Tax=Myxococcus dinghuensis TaxID=2906761 RepID=UPI0020A70510|nr:hypothetical protein [Myxococcus dinghuensis]MCP3097947.1 hypothetical protein [Myxococcus dinghuensis]
MRVVTFLNTLSRWLVLGLGLVGLQAFAGYAPIPDGYVLLATDTTNRYVVAGGARFFIPPAQWSQYSGATTVALSQATIDSYTQIPQEGTLFRQKGTTAIYVVVGQTFWWIPSPTELDYWDDFRVVNDIPNTNWNDPFISYSYGVLVQERSTSPVYLWTSGAKYLVTDPTELAYFGGWSAVKTIPLGTLASTTQQPWCGAMLRERSSSTVYALGYVNSSTPTFFKFPSTSTTYAVVPDGALSGFSTFSSGSPSCIW